MACLALMRKLQMKACILQQNSYVILGSRKRWKHFLKETFCLSSPEDLMGQRLKRHRLRSSTLVTMTFRLVHWTMGWNVSHETPSRTFWRVQRSLGHQHLGQRAQLLPRSLKGDGSTVLLNSFFVSEVERCSSARRLHCLACVLWKPLRLLNPSTRLPENEFLMGILAKLLTNLGYSWWIAAT